MGEVCSRFRVRWWGQWEKWEKCAQLVCEPCARVPGVHGWGHSKGGFLEGMCGRSVLSVSFHEINITFPLRIYHV